MDLAHEALLHNISIFYKTGWSSHNQPSVSQLLEFTGKEVTLLTVIILSVLPLLKSHSFHKTGVMVDASMYTQQRNLNGNSDGKMQSLFYCNMSLTALFRS
ncbi:hypothetical protein YC2023_042717 [Brassica napus]